MFRGCDAPDIEAKKRLRTCSLNLVPPAELLDGARCTIANSVSKADAGATRTGDDVNTKKALLEVRCPQCKKWVGLFIGRSGGVESEPHMTWYIAHSQRECPELPQYLGSPGYGARLLRSVRLRT